MLEALIFDVDGTLSETEDVHLAAFNDAFAAAGLGWQWDATLYEALLMVTGGKERIAHYLRSQDLPPMPQDDLAALHAAKTARYGALVQAGGLTLRPGIARLIADARSAGIALAIATTTSRPNVDALLTMTLGPDAPGWFAVIAAGDMVAAKKPAPDVYDLALRQLGVDPRCCVALEDSENGVASAVAACVPTVVTVSRYSTRHVFAGALAVLDTLGETDIPCRSIAGLPPDGPIVNVATLRRWLAQAP